VAEGSSKLRALKRIVVELRGAKNNQTIKDLDRIAKEFECASETTRANENRIYYAPFVDINYARVTVAIPHKGKVLKVYVGYFIQMLEEVIDRIEQIQKEQGGGTNEE